jgi:quercetin dioxygenase-like cupin family protein
MMLKAALAGAALALVALAAHAQAPKDAVLTTAAEMKGPARMLGAGKDWSYQTIVRDKDGEIEIHDHRNDILVIQEGKGTVELGGAVAGNRLTAPGEHRGGTAVGFRTQALNPGDVIYIPAGLPHLIKLAPGTKTFRYLAVKTGA